MKITKNVPDPQPPVSYTIEVSLEELRVLTAHVAKCKIYDAQDWLDDNGFRDLLADRLGSILFGTLHNAVLPND